MSEHVEVLERLRGVLEHGRMEGKRFISTDLVEKAIAALSAPAEAQPVALDYVPGELDRTAPPSVWLQIDTSADNDERGDAWPGPEGVSWHLEPIGGLEIEYVRADLASPPPIAPVEPEGFGAWFDEYTKNNYTDEMLALAAWREALAQQPAAPVGVELLCRVYADAYHAGHHATVEGGYVDVLPVDRDTYWREKVEEDYAEALAQQPPAEAQPAAWATCNRDCDCVGECKAGVERPATPPSAPVGVTHAEREVIETLLDLAYAAWSLADSSEDAGGEGLTVDRTDFAVLEKHLGSLEGLPDDCPDHTLGEVAKARWALRRLLSNTTPLGAPVGMDAEEDDELVERVARAIAKDGFSRPWEDFPDLYAHDTDQADLRDYARAALAALAGQQPAAVDEAMVTVPRWFMEKLAQDTGDCGMPEMSAAIRRVALATQQGGES